MDCEEKFDFKMDDKDESALKMDSKDKFNPALCKYHQLLYLKK